jgi:hypothetical protein
MQRYDESLPFRPRNVPEMFRLAKCLALADLLPTKYRAKPANLMLALLKGEELGLSTMQAIGTINIIDGKAEIGARLAKALVLKSGKCRLWRTIESTKERCRIEVARTDWPEGMVEVVEYDIEEANDLGLTTKGRDPEAKARNPWVTQRKNMLKRRCESRAAGDVWPDVVIAYDHGELQDTSERDESAPMVGVRRVDFDAQVAQVEAAFAGGAQPAAEQPGTDVVDGELVDEQPPAATPEHSAAAAGDACAPTRDEQATTGPAPEPSFRGASTDKLFLGALANFLDSARKGWGVDAERLAEVRAAANAQAAADLYEAIIAGVEEKKRLQQSFAGLVQPFRTTSAKSPESLLAAAQMSSAYNERAKALPARARGAAATAGATP